ncbi:hypothetical protein BJ085DRAFT_31962 [Dimargaris cristalligena]|uniref:HAUS augmin-like complex subunit 4-domain-containing protein n=1 Tax=Dimargaris cristalligena TaxID=215637 RepID=A0A4V1J443_9FUNG|nr:hypothetical protein BJ085DRAFT_31962 [Dimargaris cristalligena]|eukprot:RKP34259.1 hypothetical protein BJ085DRAFT_31962 [Dimargaris cristalligena]
MSLMVSPPLPLAVVTRFPHFAKLWSEVQTILLPPSEAPNPLEAELLTNRTKCLEVRLAYETICQTVEQKVAQGSLPGTILTIVNRERAYCHRILSESDCSQLPFGLESATPESLVLPLNTRPVIFEECEKQLNVILETVERCIPGSSRAAVPDDSTFQDTVELLIQQNRHDQQRLQNAQKQLLDDYAECFEIAQAVLSELWTASVDFLFHHESGVADAFTQYFDCIIENMCLKLKIMRYEGLILWYSPDTMSALGTLRHCLDEREKALLGKLSDVGEHLLKYQHAGPEYEKLAEAYRQIMESTRQVQEDIRRIQS